MTDAHYADDIALLANTLVEAESLLHSLEQTAGGIGRNVNENKTEYMYFEEKGVTSTVSSKPLKLDKFTYLGSNISSTESNVNIHLVKVLNAIDSLLIVWKSNLSD